MKTLLTIILIGFCAYQFIEVERKDNPWFNIDFDKLRGMNVSTAKLQQQMIKEPEVLVDENEQAGSGRVNKEPTEKRIPVYEENEKPNPKIFHQQNQRLNKVHVDEENSKAHADEKNEIIAHRATENILNEASKTALQILCVKAVNDDLKGFDVYEDCIIEKGGFGYCLNHLGKEKLCKASVGKWEIEQVEYLPESNCGTWITKTSNGCKIVLAAGYYFEHEKAFYAKSAFKYLFWKGKKPDTITQQLRNSKKDFTLKQKYVTRIYFHNDL